MNPKFDELHNSFEIEALNVTAKNYLFLNQAEKKIILEYRNHPAIRDKMVNSNLISKESHFDFLQNLKEKKEGHWILRNEKKIFGALNLTKYDEKTDSFMGGNYSNPELIGTGIGFALNFVLHKLVFEMVESNQMRAIIQRNNKNAVRMNHVFGGILEDNFKIGQEAYIEMIFKKENWTSIKKDTFKYMKYVF